MSTGRLNGSLGRGLAMVAPVDSGAMIRLNHARLASVDLGLHAHFGGFFFSGIRA